MNVKLKYDIIHASSIRKYFFNTPQSSFIIQTLSTSRNVFRDLYYLYLNHSLSSIYIHNLKFPLTSLKSSNNINSSKHHNISCYANIAAPLINNMLTTTDTNTRSLNSNENYLNPEDVHKYNFDDKCFSFLHINARSLNNSFNKLEILIEQLDFKPSIIGVSETWLNKTNYFLHNLDGYTFIESNNDRRSGGCAFFIDNNINFENIQDYKLRDSDTDEIWIKVSLPKGRKIIIATIYRRPIPNFSSFESKFLQSLDKLSSNKTNYILTGDFNIDLSNNTHSNITNYIDSFTSLGCDQIISNYTRLGYKTQKSSTLDHIYTNIFSMDIKGYSICSDLSDHFPIISFLNHSSFPSLQQQKIFKRNLSKFDESIFLEDLERATLKISSLSDLPPNEMLELFIENYERLINVHAPVKEFTPSKRRTSSKPWMNHEIRSLIQKKNRLFRKWIKLRNVNSHRKYVAARNNVTHLIKRYKLIYYNNIFNSTNSKLLWKNINRLVNYKKSRSHTIQSIQDDKKITRNPQSISNAFNNFFVNIGENLARSIPLVKKNLIKDTIQSVSRSLFLKPITPLEIQRIISNLQPNKSTPSTCAEIKFLKLSSQKISAFLSNVFNECMKMGVFPDCLKLAEVIPVFKAGSKLTVSNYRPISLLNIFSKIFEKCLFSRLSDFCLTHKIISNNQFGFRSGSSTENAVVKICNDISNHLNDNKLVCSIFLDLKKAFDTVNHNILMQKMYKYGIRGNTFQIFKDYLQNRKQYTVINGTKSSCEPISCGIPQGSILGPLLFLIYVNDINKTSNFEITLFADDSYLSLSDYSPTKLEIDVNTELTKVKSWLELNKLSLNVQKTSFMIFSKGRVKHDFVIKFGNSNLNQCAETKYLGVILDDKLSWIPHIKSIQKKVSSSTWALSRLQRFVPTESLKKVYYGLVHAKLTYCISCWGGAKNLKKLESLQNRAVKIICKAKKRDSPKLCYKSLQILQIRQCYNLQIASIMFKFNLGKWKGDFIPVRPSSIHNYHTRFASKDTYTIPQGTSDLYQRSLNYIGPSVWNDVPEAIKATNNLGNFKKLFKEHLMSEI